MDNIKEINNKIIELEDQLNGFVTESVKTGIPNYAGYCGANTFLQIFRSVPGIFDGSTLGVFKKIREMDDYSGITKEDIGELYNKNTTNYSCFLDTFFLNMYKNGKLKLNSDILSYNNAINYFINIPNFNMISYIDKSKYIYSKYIITSGYNPNFLNNNQTLQLYSSDNISTNFKYIMDNYLYLMFFYKMVGILINPELLDKLSTNLDHQDLLNKFKLNMNSIPKPSKSMYLFNYETDKKELTAWYKSITNQDLYELLTTFNKIATDLNNTKHLYNYHLIAFSYNTGGHWVTYCKRGLDWYYYDDIVMKRIKQFPTDDKLSHIIIYKRGRKL